MSSFNDYLKNTGVSIIVNRFFKGADIYSKHKITSLDYDFVEEPPLPASYYLENGLTNSHKIRVKYTLDYDPQLFYSTFEIPKEIDGAFIIEGAYRISTNKLSSDYECRIQMSGTGDYCINFDYLRRYDIKKSILKIKRFDSLTNTVDRGLEIPYDKIDSLVGEKKELLKLTETQIKKFQIKLDLDYTPEYITTKLIQECLAFGDDRIRDLIIDKKIDSVSTGFMQHMFRSNNGRNYIMARSRINDYFTKYGKLQDEITAITRLAFKYFKGSSEAKSGEANLQVPPGINAINLDSLGSKITIPETVAYNDTMSDIIDVADTPNNQNISKQNSLTVSAHITDEGVLFDVYDKEFNKITIKYLDYLNSKVCASEYVDYKKLQLKPNENGEVEVKYRMKRKMVKVDEIDLIDLHPDYRLSPTNRRIPFFNYTDSVRLSMGSSMLKQSIPLVNAQRPLVDTGNTEELHTNILNEQFEYDEGKVVEIDSDKVTIELPNGEKTEVLRRTAIQSINDVSVYTEPKVKVGQKVKKGDVICGAVGLQDDTYKMGLNTLVLFHAMFGYVNEDALVVSESYANRMTHYSIIDLSIDIKNSTSLKWIAPIGTRVRSGDSIVTIFKAVRLDEINRTLNEKLGGLFGEEGTDLTQYTIEDFLKVPNNIEEAYVSDVMIQENKGVRIPRNVKKPDFSFARESEKVMKEYDKNKDRKPIYDRFPEYVASDTLDPINLDNKNYKVVYTLRIRLIKVTGLMIASKVTNRYGGKGVRHIAHSIRNAGITKS